MRYSSSFRKGLFGGARPRGHPVGSLWYAPMRARNELSTKGLLNLSRSPLEYQISVCIQADEVFIPVYQAPLLQVRQNFIQQGFQGFVIFLIHEESFVLFCQSLTTWVPPMFKTLVTEVIHKFLQFKATHPPCFFRNSNVLKICQNAYTDPIDHKGENGKLAIPGICLQFQ